MISKCLFQLDVKFGLLKHTSNWNCVPILFLKFPISFCVFGLLVVACVFVRENSQSSSLWILDDHAVSKYPKDFQILTGWWLGTFFIFP